MEESAQQTEEQILAAHVIPPVKHSGTVQLVEYDSQWPKLFEQEAERVRRALGEDALLLEHVGSTSVPGLAAKPKIDILLVVGDSADESAYVPALEGAGYVLHIREPEWHQHRLLKGGEVDLNLHVFSQGCEEIQRMMHFRDHLRTHEGDRLLYERTKRELAAMEWEYVQNYADAKTEVVEEILRRVRRSAL
jgi:GrpB-like predicted nucleotidyltransferase (UPF0157 family)